MNTRTEQVETRYVIQFESGRWVDFSDEDEARREFRGELLTHAMPPHTSRPLRLDRITTRTITECETLEAPDA